MKRKTLLVTLALVLLLAAVLGTATTSLAQAPVKGKSPLPQVSNNLDPSNPDAPGAAQAKINAARAGLQQLANSGFKPRSIDNKNLPDAIRAAVALNASLTDAQRAQLRAVIDKYNPQMKAISDALRAAGQPTGPNRNPPNVRDIAFKLDAAVSGIDAGFRLVLTAEQYANHLAAAHPQNLPSVVRKVGSAPGSGSTKPYQDSNCVYAGWWEGIAQYWGYYGYLWAYQNYIDWGNGTYNYGYTAYIDSYYAWYDFYYAVQEMGAAYDEYLAVGSDWNYYGYYALTDAVNAYYDSYYASYYAELSYYYEGNHTDAYNAWYDLYYTNSYSYNGWYYDYYDCQ